MKNIEHIYKNVLLSTKSREQQKALVKKYLGWVSRQLKIKTNCCCDLPYISDLLNIYKSGKFRNNSHISSNQYCSISPAFSHLHVKFYCSPDPLLGSRNYFSLHFVNSSVKQGSVGSFPFFAAMNKIVQLVHS